MKTLITVVLAMFVSMSAFAIEGVNDEKMVVVLSGYNKDFTLQRIDATTCEVAVRSVESILRFMGKRKGIQLQVTETIDVEKMYQRNYIQHNRFGAQSPLEIKCGKIYK